MFLKKMPPPKSKGHSNSGTALRSRLIGWAAGRAAVKNEYVTQPA